MERDTPVAGDADFSSGESGRATEIVDSGRFPAPAVENVLIRARSGALRLRQARFRSSVGLV
ncbi:hypothetical protein [Streptomyces sp. NPDC001508]|uniref:hypothetical protein n=1 Tax=Streptomyces sp. NPDC001508 TaxID=3154656 RepID=UPI00331FADC8